MIVFLLRVLKNTNLNVKYLNLLRSRGNVIIALEAERIIDEIFNEVEKFILRENITADSWKGGSIEDLSLGLLPKIIQRFKNGSITNTLRPEQLMKSREEVKSIAEQVRGIVAKKANPPVNTNVKTNVNTNNKVYVPALQRFAKNSFSGKAA